MGEIKMTTTTIAPTTEATVNAQSSFGFSCYVQLAETERIFIEMGQMVYDQNLRKYVLSADKEKYQLEELQYHLGYGDEANTATFHNAVVRGFRKDGALRYRTTYIPHHAIQEVLKQIPDQYHDYARQAFDEKMAELQKKLDTTIKNGVVIK